jgi:hypothetical protein
MTKYERLEKEFANKELTKEELNKFYNLTENTKAVDYEKRLILDGENKGKTQFKVFTNIVNKALGFSFVVKE